MIGSRYMGQTVAKQIGWISKNYFVWSWIRSATHLSRHVSAGQAQSAAALFITSAEVYGRDFERHSEVVERS